MEQMPEYSHAQLASHGHHDEVAARFTLRPSMRQRAGRTQLNPPKSERVLSKSKSGRVQGAGQIHYLELDPVEHPARSSLPEATSSIAGARP
jgi:hypothetical protein